MIQIGVGESVVVRNLGSVVELRTQSWVRRHRHLVTIFLFVAGLGYSLLIHSQQSPAPPLSTGAANPVNALWVAETDRIDKVAATDGAILLSIPIQSPRALTIDPRRSIVWVYGHSTLRAYDFNGVSVVAVPVAVSGDDDKQDDDESGGGGHVALAVDQTDGAVWLAINKSLLKFSTLGNPLANTSLSEEIHNLSFDQAGRVLWVATEKEVVAYDHAGTRYAVLPLGAKASVQDITFDPKAKQLWVALKDEIRRYYPNGTLSLTLTVNKVERLAADGRGRLWTTTEKRLLRIDANGAVLTNIEAFDGEGDIVALAADPQEGGAWVAREKHLRHIATDGRVLLDTRLPKSIRALASNSDTIAPDLSITLPQDASYVNTKTPAIELAFSDIGTGVDTSTLLIQLNGGDLSVTCTYTTTTAKCSSAIPFPEGLVELTATIADFAGNRSLPARSRVTVDTVPPRIILDAPQDRAITGNPNVLFIGRLTEMAALALNGKSVVVKPDYAFNHGPIALTDGQNRFELVATDPAGNTSRVSIMVTLDKIPPIVTPPADVIAEATGTLTPVSLGIGTAIDNAPGILIRPVPDQTGPFPLGTRTVTWRATDAAGNIGIATQRVTIRDTTPPRLQVPPPVTATSNVPVAVTLGTASATDLFGPVSITNDAPALFPVGTTTVTWKAVDANGNGSIATQTVTVGTAGGGTVARNGWGVPQHIAGEFFSIYSNPSTVIATSSKIVAGGASEAMAVWSVTGGSVWARHLRDGGQWGADEEVGTTGTAGDAYGVDAAMGTNGNAMVVWENYDGGRMQIWAGRYLMGNGWETPELIGSDPVKNSYEPMMAMDDQGNAVAIWTRSERVTGSTIHKWARTLWAARFDAGQGWKSPQLIGTNDGGTREIAARQIGMDGAGNATVTWATCETANINIIWGDCRPWTLRTNRYTNGTGWDAPAVLDFIGDSTYALETHMTVGRGGNAILVWNNGDPVRDYVRVRFFSPGLGWSSRAMDFLGTGDIFTHIEGEKTAIDPVGNAVVVWQEDRNIWAAHYPASTFNVVGADKPPRKVRLSDDANIYRENPAVSMDSSGNAIAVWNEEGNRLLGRYYKAGLDWGPIGRVDDTLSRADSSYVPGIPYLTLTMDGSGNAYAIWQQRDDNRYSVYENIWANRFASPSQNQPPVANAGSDQSVDEGSTVTLDGAGSYDPDGAIYRYLWTQTAGPPVVLAGADSARATFTAPTVDADVTLRFELKVIDAFQASATDTVTITVRNLTPAQDKVPPLIVPPDDLIVEATGLFTPVSLGTGTAFDNADGPLISMPDKTGPFALGVHTIVWTARDSAGNVGTATQRVTVRDTTPPMLTVPPDITLTSSAAVAVDLGSASATDIFPPVTVSNDAPALFPPGITVVTWRATDANGNTATRLQMVTVKTPPGQAGWSTPEVIDTAPGNALSPQIAFNSQGNGMAVWTQNDGSRERTYARPYVAGNGWGAVSILDVATASYVAGPRVAVDPNDNAVVVWSQTSGANRSRIWSSRYTTGGGWSAAEAIGPETVSTYGAQVAVDASGNAMAVWPQSGPTFTNIWANRYVPGTGWGSAVEIDLVSAGGTTSKFASSPQLAMNAGGNALAIWLDRGRIWSNRYVPGQGWQYAIDTGSSANSAPIIGMDGVGNAMVVWPGYSSPYYLLWSKRYIAGTNSWEAATQFPLTSVDAGNPQLAVNSSGQAAVVWDRQVRAGERFGLYTSRYVPGSGWDALQLIDTSVGDSDAPQVAIDAAGNATAVWVQAATDIWAGGDIWANRYVVGKGWGTAEHIEAGRNLAGRPQVAITPSGTTTAVWDQPPDGTISFSRDIWASRYNAGGIGGGNTIPPVVIPPADVTKEATAVLTPVTLGAASAVDDVDGPLPATPDRTGPFPLGTHKVTWSAIDSSGNVGRAVQTVTVKDTTPPVLVAPPDVTLSGTVTAANLGTATASDIFSPVAITHNAPAALPIGVTQVTWTATDPSGNTVTAVQTVTVKQTFSLTIVSPALGQTIDDGTVLVTGTLEAPANTGVVVNGVVAAIDRNIVPARFYATVPLQLGGNTLTAIATQSDGVTLIRTVDVVSVGLSAFEVVATPASGIAPLTVTFTIADRGGNGIRKIEVDYEGDGIIDFSTTDSGVLIQHVYTTPSLYLPRIIITDGLGARYNTQSVISALTLSEVDAVIQRLWQGVTNNLAAGNIDSATTSFSVKARERYRQVLLNIAPGLSAMFANFPTIHATKIGNGDAEYFVVLPEGGTSYGYFIYFMQGPDGVWRLQAM